MEQKSNAFLEQESIGILMRKYSVPCIISMVVAALYNIVDQIFIMFPQKTPASVGGEMNAVY